MSAIQTPELDALFRAAESGLNLFVAGRAGTGKSTSLREIRSRAENADKMVVALAPTGVAANNVGGMTIHKFFRFPIHPLDDEDHEAAAWNPRNWNARDIMGALDILIIDEVSMVRVDLLHAVDQTMRIVRGMKNRKNSDKPFGGAQVLLFGDPYQLPPVTKEDVVGQSLQARFGSDLFFCAPACGQVFGYVELTHIFRQRDADLREILNAIREGSATQAQLDRLNQCVRPPNDEAVRLVPTRFRASQINAERLAALGQEIVTIDAMVQNMKESDSPVEFKLQLAVGARVMLCVNKPGYFNGQLGTVEGFDVVMRSPAKGEPEEETLVCYVNTNGRRVEVATHTWERYEYALSPAGKLTRTVAGFVRQLPIRLAWAMTIHKAQGLTIDNLHVDLDGGAFAPGQTYVALSRATGWEGLSLERPVLSSDIMVDPAVRWFRSRFIDMVANDPKKLLTVDAA